MFGLAFELAWLLLGLAVFLVALSGGPRGLRARLQSQTRRGRRVAGFVLAPIFMVFGLVIPAVILLSDRNQSEKAGPAGLELTAAESRGRDKFVDKCATCHTLDAANAVGKVGPDLDELRPNRALTLDAIVKGRARGEGQMPALLFEGRDAREVAQFVAAVAGR